MAQPYLRGQKSDLFSVSKNDDNAIKYITELTKTDKVRQFMPEAVLPLHPKDTKVRVKNSDSYYFIVATDSENVGNPKISINLENTVGDSVPVGFVTLKNMHGRKGSALLITALDPSIHGQQYARDSVAQTLDFGFTRLRLHRIEIRTLEYNTRTQKVVQALAQEEGAQRNHIHNYGNHYDYKVYSILESEWENIKESLPDDEFETEPPANQGGDK